MLQTTLATSFVPGTNLQADAIGANWSFLLPSLEPGNVLCLGRPPCAALRSLSRRASAVVVLCRDFRSLRATAATARKYRLPNVLPIRVDPSRKLPLWQGRFDLAAISDRRLAQRLSRSRALREELRRVLKPHGLIYCEVGHWAARPTAGRTLRKLSAHYPTFRPLWLTPTAGGELHTAVPLGDRETIDYFLHHRLDCPAIRRSPFRQLERLANACFRWDQLVRRRAALLGHASNGTTDRPPQYLREIAGRAGIDLDGYRWGLSTPGKYMSRKVLFFLFDRTGTSPDYLVKLTRDPALNYRLENERVALELLREMGFGDPATVPRAAFFGRHAGLAVLGESAVRGVPFDRRTTFTADCPAARAVIGRITELGEATAQRDAATPSQIAEGLQTLLDRFVRIYHVTQKQLSLLESEIAAIAQCREPIPLVFQHGDPGAWNVLITSRGEAALLDWEAAEPQGMPLWDLFYFLRSYAVRMARRTNTRNALKGFRQCFLRESSLSPWVDAAVRQYCQRIELPRRLVGPLYYTCWMHRALKEATRLCEAGLQRGHYVSLLRSCLDRQLGPFFVE